ncbi:hypothetical protein AX14_011091 [Amanita brunnescens Koide BX004]|nr:hypothetical protein AX14_011091 [Amanita brunnescens Koide BX004]
MRPDLEKIWSYFTGQITRYKWDSATSRDYEFNIGTPQGDCISPILSAIYLAAGIKVALPLPFPPPNVHSLFFVDDGLLYCASSSLQQNTERIATLGLFIDVDKTELIHFPGFDKNKKARQLASLPLQPSIAIRSPGFYFDSELNWNAHITFYLNRAFSTIRALRMLGSSIHGLGTLQKRHSYQACVIPVLTYGLPLWFAHDGVGVFPDNAHWSKGSHRWPPPSRHTGMHNHAPGLPHPTHCDGTKME